MRYAADTAAENEVIYFLDEAYCHWRGDTGVALRDVAAVKDNVSVGVERSYRASLQNVYHAVLDSVFDVTFTAEQSPDLFRCHK